MTDLQGIPRIEKQVQGHHIDTMSKVHTVRNALELATQFFFLSINIVRKVRERERDIYILQIEETKDTSQRNANVWTLFKS